MVPLIISFFFLTVIHTTDKITAQYICKFSILPKEVLNHIVWYIQFTNKDYETDGFFIDRIRSSKGMLQEAQLSDTQSLKIQDGSLELIAINGGVDNKQKLIWGGPPFKKLGETLLPEEKREVSFFNVSPTNNFCAAYIKKRERPWQTIEEIELLKLNNSHYTHNSFHDLGETSFITALATSNIGQLAFVGFKDVVKLLRVQGKVASFEEIYPISKKYAGPVLPDRVLEYSLQRANKIVDILFNRQSTKLVIKFHLLYECLLDKNQITETVRYNELLFRKLLTQWFLKNYKEKYQGIYSKLCDKDETGEIVEMLDRPISSPEEFWEKLEKILEPNIFTRVQEAILEGNDESCPIKIIPLCKDQEEPWTLDKYFKLKGVCKDLNKQCGFKDQ
jgi:hypothetical protein